MEVTYNFKDGESMKVVLTHEDVQIDNEVATDDIADHPYYQSMLSPMSLMIGDLLYAAKAADVRATRFANPIVVINNDKGDSHGS